MCKKALRNGSRCNHSAENEENKCTKIYNVRAELFKLRFETRRFTVFAVRTFVDLDRSQLE